MHKLQYKLTQDSILPDKQNWWFNMLVFMLLKMAQDQNFLWRFLWGSNWKKESQKVWNNKALLNSNEGNKRNNSYDDFWKYMECHIFSQKVWNNKALLNSNEENERNNSYDDFWKYMECHMFSQKVWNKALLHSSEENERSNSYDDFWNYMEYQKFYKRWFLYCTSIKNSLWLSTEVSDLRSMSTYVNVCVLMCWSW